MSAAHYPLPGLLFASVLFHPNFEHIDQLTNIFETEFGQCQRHQLSVETMQKYYEKELSSINEGSAFESRKLERWLLVGLDPRPRKDLIGAKKRFWELEEQSKIQGLRKVNWDPGLINEEQVILSTGKPYAHRIYLGEGIYADLTLIAQKQKFVALPWTYPDYAGAQLIEIFDYYRKHLISLNRHLHLSIRDLNHDSSPQRLLEN